MSYTQEWDQLDQTVPAVYDELNYLSSKLNSAGSDVDSTLLAAGLSPDATQQLASPFYDADFNASLGYSAPSLESQLSYGGSPSPLPALSPPNSGTAFSSPASSASSSSYSGLISPQTLPPSRQSSSNGQQAYLLPAAELNSPVRGMVRRASLQPDSRSPSWFADAQDQYLAQQAYGQPQMSQYTPPVYHQPTHPDYLLHRSASRGSVSSQAGPSHLSPYSRLNSDAAPFLNRRGSTGAMRYDAMAGNSATKGPRISPVRRASLIANGETPVRPGMKRRGSRLSIAVPPPPHFDPNTCLAMEPQTPGISGVPQTQAEMDQLMQIVDMMSSLDGQQQGERPVPTHTVSAPVHEGKIEVSGVALDAEDLGMLASPDMNDFHDSRSHGQYPASAPAWQTTFNLSPPAPPMPFHGQYHLQQVGHIYPPSPTYAPQQYCQYALPPSRRGSMLSPPTEFATPDRPHSAPGTPDTSSALAVPPQLRRGSSFDAGVFASQEASVALQASVGQPAAPKLAPPPKPAKSPKRAGTGKKGKKDGQGIGGMFVNYGAADAKKLLSGVAPSGSSKRKAEEAAAAEAARQAALVDATPAEEVKVEA